MMNLTESLLTRMGQDARDAATRSHCPYSGFPVGAAVLTGSGAIFSGCNVENASYGLSMCAERVAIFHAVAGGEREIRAVVLFTPTSEPIVPCGACLQVMQEFGPGAIVVSICGSGKRIETSLDALLPHAFGPRDLEKAAAGGRGDGNAAVP